MRLPLRAALLMVSLLVVPAAAEQEVAKLLAVIQSTEAAENERANAFEKIGDLAGPDAVDALAEYLDDEKWSHYARFALQKMPEDAATEALLDSLNSLEGDLKLGVIATLGRRGDEEAVSHLEPLLASSDARVSAAAAVALGGIATSGAADALTKALAGENDSGQKEALASSLLMVGQRLAKQGKSEAAIDIFDQLRKADIPKAYRIGATHYAIRTRGADGVELLVQQLKSSDLDFFETGLALARRLPGHEATQAVADVLQQEETTARQILLVLALKDRGDVDALAAIQERIESDETLVQLAAIAALGELGGPSSVSTLLSIANQQNRDAVLQALVSLEAEGVDEKLIEAAAPSGASGASVLAVEALGRRRVEEAVPRLLELSQSDSPAVSEAAVVALGKAAPQERFLDLVGLLKKAESPERKQAVQQAIRAAVSRSTHPDVCAAALGALIPSSAGAEQEFLFEQIRAAGGPKAVALMRQYATGSDEKLQDAATKTLGTWLSADAAPVLLEVAEGDGKYANRALGGYIRIFRQFELPEEERVAMAAKALRVADRPNERNAAIEALTRFPSLGSFELALEQLDVAGSEQVAAKAVLTIGRTVLDLNPNQAKAGLKRLIQANVSPEATQAAREMLN